MLDKMFIPKDIPEKIQDDDILRHVLQEKSKLVAGLVEKLTTATALPMSEVKDYLSKVLK